jgi:hypothetical protein
LFDKRHCKKRRQQSDRTNPRNTSSDIKNG